MRQFFPENAVEFFVSYYDYFQPEMYLPGSDRFIPKDSAINDHLERLRLSTTKSLIERRDTIVVASVSSIYGLGDPNHYRALQVQLAPQMRVDKADLIQRLGRLQYDLTEHSLKRGTYRINGNIIDIFPADSEHNALRLDLTDGVISSLCWIDAASGNQLESITRYSVSPKTLFAPSNVQAEEAADQIMVELDERVAELNLENRLTEANRLYERITHDVEMLRSVGYCSGMENYASYFSGRDAKLPPTTLLDYLPKDGLLFIDESHVMIPQITAMFRGDQARKDTLIDYGFRLPSSKNNHPLSFSEFESIKPQTIFISATPGAYELKVSNGRVVEQIVRPTGLLDPVVEVRPSADAIENLIGELQTCVAAGNRVLITTLTKAVAEGLHEHLGNKGFRVRYLHSDIKTTERTEILDSLRAGEFDILIGISLLREGLDIPEAALIAIMDADHAGFLRSTNALIQMIGRVARNVAGKAILYADKITPAMQQAMDETLRRRQLQIAYNQEHHVTPVSSARKLNSEPGNEAEDFAHPSDFCANLAELCHRITVEEHQLLVAADDHDDERIEKIRKRLDGLYRQFIHV